MIFNDKLYKEALILIDDKMISITCKSLSEYGMTTLLITNEVCDDISREFDYHTTALQNYVTSVKPELLPEQKQVFSIRFRAHKHIRRCIIFLRRTK